ncbi:unnamed protein product [Mytilus edulis]|uniref:Uncharacterized protein n=1 Tax=Mytilus edulis TaxID=6550 RepID=A0A8S3UW89_MYTED|nr:unnamed protein product [Mytilus edulis]
MHTYVKEHKCQKRKRCSKLTKGVKKKGNPRPWTAVDTIMEEISVAVSIHTEDEKDHPIMTHLWSSLYVLRKFLLHQKKSKENSYKNVVRFTCCRVSSCELRKSSCELRKSSCELRKSSCELRKSSCELQKSSCELRVKKVELRVTKVELRVTKVELRVKKVELRVTKVELRVKKVELRVTKVELRVKKVELRVTKVELRKNVETKIF